MSLNKSMSLESLARMRTVWMAKWAKRAEELKGQESSYKDALHPACKEILAPKQLLLFREILVECNYPDLGAFEELAFGTELTGEVPAAGIFAPTFKPAKCTAESLKCNAVQLREDVLKKVRPLGELDEAVLKKTLEERDAGWLEGPSPLSELEEHAVLSRRFGVMQGPKMRVIDDYSMSGVNSAVQVSESPKPHATDKVAALCLSLLAHCGQEPVMGRTFDLKSAYRQLSIAPQSSWASYVACWGASTRMPRVFRMRALPFGASRAVYAFLRVAMALWFIASDQLAVPWTSFFDDYVSFGAAAGCKHLQCTI